MAGDGLVPTVLVTPIVEDQRRSVGGIDLTSPTGWTQIIGSGTFEDALRTVERFHVRHDLPPFVMMPDEISGDVGIDQLLITSDVVDARPTTWGRIKTLYR